MIARLLGFDLAGHGDPRLWKGVVLGFLAAVCDALPYLILVFVFHALFNDAGAASALLVFVALLLAFLGSWFFKASALLDSFAATYSLVADMRLAMADRLGRMSMGSIGRHRGATLADLFTDRFSLYQDIVTHMWWQVSATAGFPALLWLLLVMVDWRQGLVMAAFVPVAIVIVPWSFRLLDRATDKVIPARDEAANRVVEVVEGAKEIRVFDPERRRLQAAAAAMDDLERKSLATELAPAPAILAFGLVWSIALASTIIAGALLWTGGHVSTFQLIAGLVLAARLSASLNELGIFLIEYRFARRTLGTIRAFAGEKLLPVSATPARPARASVELSNVSFAHAEETTISNVSIMIPEGTMTAIVGPSSSGKSTLAALVARLWDVDDGGIRIGGVDVRDMAPEVLNETVSMVLQDVSLFELSVEDNVRLGRPSASRAEVEAACHAARIHERIMELPQGYATILEGGGTQLSGGERQRLAIARALLKDAPVLVLDEATASIDVDNERLIQEALEELAAGRTVIMIAHRLWTIQDADQIIVLDQGRVVQSGRHDRLLADRNCDLYRRLWASAANSAVIFPTSL